MFGMLVSCIGGLEPFWWNGIVCSESSKLHAIHCWKVCVLWLSITWKDNHLKQPKVITAVTSLDIQHQQHLWYWSLWKQFWQTGDVNIPNRGQWERECKSTQVIAETWLTDWNVLQLLSQSSENTATVSMQSAFCSATVVITGLWKLRSLLAVVAFKGGGWPLQV